MFIRKDLEEAIKNKFGINKLVYKGTGENTFNGFGLLWFETDKGFLAIETGFYEDDYYYIYKINEFLRHPEFFYEDKLAINSLHTFEGRTYLKVGNDVTSFPGIAFDFTQELVLLALENKT